MAPERRATAAQDAAVAGFLALGFIAGLGGLRSLLSGVDWWFQASALVLIVLGVSTLIRVWRGPGIGATLAGVLAGVITMTVMFVREEAIFGVIPGPEAFERLGLLWREGELSVLEQVTPAIAVPGIRLFVCTAVLALVLAADALALYARVPALSGIAFAALLIAPGLIRPVGVDPVVLVVTVIAYLGLLLASRPRLPGRNRIGFSPLAAGALVIVAALAVPALLPPARSGPGSGAGVLGVAAINPLIDLGDDLRRGGEQLALTYIAEDPQYLRLLALDVFSGDRWAPSDGDSVMRELVDLPAPPGLGEDIAAREIVTEIDLGRLDTAWLPVPYPVTSVTGLDGSWTLRPDLRAIGADGARSAQQSYVATSLSVEPTPEQLRAAPPSEGLDRLTAVPEDLPEVVTALAAEVTEGTTTDYDRALALQQFFRDGAFEYSESAPVEDGYDSSGAEALEAFLAVRSGYCVHFSSAMAAMARVLGIPARVAVGFTPGIRAPSGEFRVSTHDLHAWPELYFGGIGWVRFEPTPSRGTVPSFAAEGADGAPAAPQTPEETTPEEDAATPEGGPTPEATGEAALPEELEDFGQGDAGSSADAAPALVPLVVTVTLLVLLLHGATITRAVLGGRRRRSAARGDAVAAWRELLATAVDHGYRPASAESVRQAATSLAKGASDRAQEAILRLRDAAEAAGYARQNGAEGALNRDLRLASRDLRRRATARRRLRAWFLPRSLWAPASVPRVDALKSQG